MLREGWRSKFLLALGLTAVVVSGVYVEGAGDLLASVVETGAVGSSPVPEKVRVVTNRYVVLDDPNEGGEAASPDFTAVQDSYAGGWGGSDHWNGEATMVRSYALVMDGEGEPIPNMDVEFVFRDWSGGVQGSVVSSTNGAGIAEAVFDLNDVRRWGFWSVTGSVDGVSDKARFMLNWWGCSNCHNQNIGMMGADDPATDLNNPSYSRSPYVEGYEGAHIQGMMGMMDGGGGGGMMCRNPVDMRTAVEQGRCVYCHQGYGGTNPGVPSSATGGQTTWGAMRGDVVCPDCHTPNGDPVWLADGGDGNGLPRMPSCFNGQCHNVVNPNVNPWRTTTVANNLSQFSRIWVTGGAQPSGAPLKAHSVYEDGGDVPCVMCHGPMHNVTVPYPAGLGNGVTEDEHCYECHGEVKHSEFQAVSVPQPCTDCHTMNIHNISGSWRFFDSARHGVYDENRNTRFVDDPAWGLWQRWEVAYNSTYSAATDPYRSVDVGRERCESCHVGPNQKRGVHRIDFGFTAPDNAFMASGGSGLDCVVCHNSNLDGGRQGVHSAHPASYGGSRTGCACHDGTLGSVPMSLTTGVYSVEVFGVTRSYDGSVQTCWECHGDWHRNPVFDESRFPTLSQGVNETLRIDAGKRFPGPFTGIGSAVSPGVKGFGDCTVGPCHFGSAHEAMRSAVSGERFPLYGSGGTPGCDECHALNRFGTHMEALTEMYGNGSSLHIRSACDTCHFEARRDEGYMSNIYQPFN